MPKFSVKKPLTVFVVTLAVVILGVVAYMKMTPDLMPNMDFPYVIVVTSDPGASPESIEQNITYPLEESMATLDHIKSISSTSQDSVSMVVMEFEDGVNMDTLSIDIQQKLTALQGVWDESVMAPYMLKINPSMLPAMVAGVSFEGKSVEELSDFVDEELEQKLVGIPGVASVDISGTVQRQMHIILDEKRLDKKTGELVAAVRRELNDAEEELEEAKEEVEDALDDIEDARAEMGEGLGGLLSGIMYGISDQSVDPDSIDPTKPEGQLTLMLLSIQESEEKISENKLTIKKNQATIGQLMAQMQTASPTALPALKEQVDAFTAANKELEMKNKAEQAEIDTIDAQLKAAGFDRKAQMAAQADAQKQMAALADIKKSSEQMEQILEGASSLTEADMMLSSVLSQIESGLETIEEQREDLYETLDMGEILTLSTVEQLLTAQDFSMPAGYIDDNDGVSYMVSVGDSLASRGEVEGLVLFDPDVDGVAPVLLSDIATVVYTDNADEIYAKLNNVNGIIATFTKQSTWATAEVSENITARFDELRADYPGLDFKPLMDQGDYIYLIVETILSSLLWGAVFSVVVLAIFLRDWRPTLITLISIPTSVVFAIVLMYFSGVTINMISLSGLAVSVGMLVDNSVVVIENIYRLRARGATVRQAAVAGARQVGGAVTSSTLTTVCVFAPIVFVEGMTRDMFSDLALTMGYALLASLLVALSVVPAMASGMLRRLPPAKPGLLDHIYPIYRKGLSWSLDHKAAILLLSLVLLVGSAALTLRRGFAFMPPMDMNTVTVTVTMPEDCTRDAAETMADEVSRRIMTVEGVDTVGTMMDTDTTTAVLSGGESSAYSVSVYVTMPDDVSGNAVGQEIERLCADMDCEVTAANVMDGMMSMVSGSGVSLQVRGEDMEQLHKAAALIAETVEKVEGTADVSDGLEESAPALHVSVDREKAMSHGYTVAQIYLEVAQALSTSSAAQNISLDNTTMSMSIEKDENALFTRENLLTLEITPQTDPAAAGGMSGGMSGGSMDMDSLDELMEEEDSDDEETDEEEKEKEEEEKKEEEETDKSFTLGEVATIEETVSLQTISHTDQLRTLTVSCGIAPGHNVTLVSQAVEKAVDGLTLPEGISVAYTGENENILEAMGQLLLMLVLGIVLVYFIMVAQFQSLREPFVVMFTIPLAFTGGFLMLLAFDMEVSVISMIGFVMLVGIIVNNGIVLVDHINQRRHEGVERREAVIEAGVTRMRPILMTSLTTILGLAVMALAKNAGTSLMRPVALVCIGGLAYATLMTLLVVPCMYEIISKKRLRTVTDEELALDEE